MLKHARKHCEKHTGNMLHHYSRLHTRKLAWCKSKQIGTTPTNTWQQNARNMPGTVC